MFSSCDLGPSRGSYSTAERANIHPCPLPCYNDDNDGDVDLRMITIVMIKQYTIFTPETLGDGWPFGLFRTPFFWHLVLAEQPCFLLSLPPSLPPLSISPSLPPPSLFRTEVGNFMRAVEEDFAPFCTTSPSPFKPASTFSDHSIFKGCLLRKQFVSDSICCQSSLCFNVSFWTHVHQQSSSAVSTIHSLE